MELGLQILGSSRAYSDAVAGSGDRALPGLPGRAGAALAAAEKLAKLAKLNNNASPASHVASLPSPPLGLASPPHRTGAS
jgi:hypothetical protein